MARCGRCRREADGAGAWHVTIRAGAVAAVLCADCRAAEKGVGYAQLRALSLRDLPEPDRADLIVGEVWQHTERTLAEMSEADASVQDVLERAVATMPEEWLSQGDAVPRMLAADYLLRSFVKRRQQERG